MFFYFLTDSGGTTTVVASFISMDYDRSSWFPKPVGPPQCPAGLSPHVHATVIILQFALGVHTFCSTNTHWRLRDTGQPFPSHVVVRRPPAAWTRRVNESPSSKNTDERSRQQTEFVTFWRLCTENRLSAGSTRYVFNVPRSPGSSLVRFRAHVHGVASWGSRELS